MSLRSAAFGILVGCTTNTTGWDIEKDGLPVCEAEYVAPPADIPLPELPVDALRGLVLLPHPELGNPETIVTFTGHGWTSEWVMPTSTPIDPDPLDPPPCFAPAELHRGAHATAHVADRAFDVPLVYRVPHDRTREPTLGFGEADVTLFGFEAALDAWWVAQHSDGGGFLQGALGAMTGGENRWNASTRFGGSPEQMGASAGFDGETAPLPADP